VNAQSYQRSKKVHRSSQLASKAGDQNKVEPFA